MGTLEDPDTALLLVGAGLFCNVFRFANDAITTASQSSKQDDDKKKKKKDTNGDSNHSISTATATATGGGADEEENHTTDDNDDSASERKVGLEKWIPYISAFVHTGLFVYFLTMTILSSTTTASTTRTRYTTTVFGATTIGIAFGLLTSLRDFQRKRFSIFQRLCSMSSSMLILIGCIVQLSERGGEGGGGGLSTVDYFNLILLIVYFLLTLLESKICSNNNNNNSASTKETNTNDDGQQMNTNKKAHLGKNIWIILKPYFWPNATATSAILNRTRAILTWVCVGSSKACNLIAPIFIGRASTALIQGNYRKCGVYAILYSLTQLGNSFFRECQSLIYLKVAQAAFVQLSEYSFKHLHQLSLDWHLRKKLGEVIRSMDRGIIACDTLMKFLFLWLVPAIGECIAVCIIFAVYFEYFPIALCIFTFVFIYMIWTICLTLWRKKFRKNVSKSDNDYHDKCTDSLVNFETVKYFTAESYEIERFSEAVQEYQKSSVQVQASLSFLNISQVVLMQSCLALALVLAAIGIRRRAECCIDNGCSSDDVVGTGQCCTNLESSGVCSGMEIGDFVSVLTYTINLFAPLNFLGSVYNAIVMSMIDLRNLSELLAETPDVVDNPDAISMPKMNENVTIESDEDVAVEFDNVVFHYPSQPDTKGLRGVSFKMMRGTTTAIVGTTGAGKTTVSRLLFRFYDVLGGAVKVNGVDVRSISQKSLREAMGVVPQATTMFNDSIRANILYGRRSATESELESVAESAQILKFIQSLPDGWETSVGDRGLKLSGGEKQRVAIARCLLKNPPFVILDEATSALDSVTENSVQEALDALGSDRTCLVIAHRLGTIKNADKIIVLGDGLVLEEGTHDELLEKQGKYAEMWNMQLSSTDENIPEDTKE